MILKQFLPTITKRNIEKTEGRKWMLISGLLGLGNLQHNWLVHNLCNNNKLCYTVTVKLNEIAGKLHTQTNQ